MSPTTSASSSLSSVVSLSKLKIQQLPIVLSPGDSHGENCTNVTDFKPRPDHHDVTESGDVNHDSGPAHKTNLSHAQSVNNVKEPTVLSGVTRSLVVGHAHAHVSHAHKNDAMQQKEVVVLGRTIEEWPVTSDAIIGHAQKKEESVILCSARDSLSTTTSAEYASVCSFADTSEKYCSLTQLNE